MRTQHQAMSRMSHPLRQTQASISEHFGIHIWKKWALASFEKHLPVTAVFQIFGFQVPWATSHDSPGFRRNNCWSRVPRLQTKMSLYLLYM
jgi:hypothetical protein